MPGLALPLSPAASIKLGDRPEMHQDEMHQDEMQEVDGELAPGDGDA
jgi:hypothetical protein